MSNSLAGRIALVTGGSRGIGLAIADALLHEGADVTVTARNGVRLRAAVREVRQRCTLEAARIRGVKADVGRLADVRAVMRAMKDRGGLDILVNCAGVAGFSTVEEQAPEQWDQVMATNLSGAFYCSHEAIPVLKAGGGGWILNVGSLAVRTGFPVERHTVHQGRSASVQRGPHAGASLRRHRRLLHFAGTRGDGVREAVTRLRGTVAPRARGRCGRGHSTPSLQHADASQPPGTPTSHAKSLREVPAVVRVPLSGSRQEPTAS